MRRIEVCCGCMEDVIAARDGGAVRVELCSALGVGGVTPSAGLIVGAVRERGDMKIHVLIRPREGDFVYTSREVAVMEADIEAAKTAGADGVAIGALKADGTVDEEAMRRLLGHCAGISVTFHRAFDECADPLATLETLIGYGVDRVLTSGCRESAAEGAEFIRRLVDAAAGRIIIMPGAGISPANIAWIEQMTGAPEFHGTASDKHEPQRASRLFGLTPRHTSDAIVRQLVESH